MLAFIGFLVVMALLIANRKEIFGMFSSDRGKETDTGTAILDFSLSAVLTKLTAEQRIIFRDNVNGYLSTIYSRKDMNRVLDLNNILNLVTLYTAKVRTDNISKDAEDCIELVLNIIDSQIKLAPSNYSRLITVKQLMQFLQQRI